MWIVEKLDNQYHQYLVTAWASENDALKHAAHEMVLHINNVGDPNNNMFIRIVKKINDNLKTNNYRMAIELWNNCIFNGHSVEAKFWTVRDLTPQKYIKPNSFGAALGTQLFPFLIEVKEPEPDANGMINNYTCKMCSNNRLNKKEKSCWSCGTAIKP